MKIRVGRRFPKIRILISTPVRFCMFIRCLVRKVSSFVSPGRTSRKNSLLCLRRPQPVGSPLRTRTCDGAACSRRRKMVPKGCVAVYVGAERQRFVIPIIYLSHPFISKLLAREEAEGEVAYSYGGPLTVPCDVGDFEQVKWLVDRETNAVSLNFRPDF